MPRRTHGTPDKHSGGLKQAKGGHTRSTNPIPAQGALAISGDTNPVRGPGTNKSSHVIPLTNPYQIRGVPNQLGPQDKGSRFQYDTLSRAQTVQMPLAILPLRKPKDYSGFYPVRVLDQPWTSWKTLSKEAQTQLRGAQDQLRDPIPVNMFQAM